MTRDDARSPSLGFRTAEREGRLVVEPDGLPMRGVVAWLAFVHVAILGFLAKFGDGRDLRIALAFMALEAPTLLAILAALDRAERAKGAFLEIDPPGGVIRAPRLGRTFRTEDVEAVRFAVGWTRDDEGWAWSGELSLALREAGPDGPVPILRHGDVRAVERLAGRVALAVDRPLIAERAPRTWRPPA